MHDPIERLVRAAGRRSTPNLDRRERARTAVHAAWRDAARARTRRYWIRIGAPALAAAAVVVVAIGLWQAPAIAPAPGVRLARVVTSTAALRVTNGSLTRIMAAGDLITSGAAVETAPGVVATFALDGGGELRQNGDSLVRWVAAQHVAIDRGQIYVDSGSRAGGSLAIDTFAGRVRDIGTRFDVQVRDGRLRVRVRDGEVRLDAASGSHQAGAGRELLAGAAGEVSARPTATFGADWDWILRATRFRVEGATLERFLAWVERDGGRTVEFADPRARDQVGATVLHGSIDGLTMEQTLEAILPTTGLVHRIAGDRVILERPSGERR